MTNLARSVIYKTQLFLVLLGGIAGGVLICIDSYVNPDGVVVTETGTQRKFEPFVENGEILGPVIILASLIGIYVVVRATFSKDGAKDEDAT